MLASAAGARRTATSLERFQHYSRAADVEVFLSDATPALLHTFAASEGVADVVRRRGVFGRVAGQDFLPTAAALDDRFGRDIDRARIVDGRAPRSDEPDEVGIGEVLAKRLHIRAGSQLQFETFSAQQLEQVIAGSDPGPPKGPKVQLHVVGIVRRPLDLAGRGASGGVVVMTPAFVDRYGNEIGSFGDVLRVRTRHGAADVPKAVAAARRIFGKSARFDVQNLGIETEGARAAIDVLSVALWLFAAIAALAALAFIAVTVSRHIRSSESDQATLDALGMSRVHRVLGTAAPALPIAIGGAVLAVLGAALASPLSRQASHARQSHSSGFDSTGPCSGSGSSRFRSVSSPSGCWPPYERRAPESISGRADLLSVGRRHERQLTRASRPRPRPASTARSSPDEGPAPRRCGRR